MRRRHERSKLGREGRAEAEPPSRRRAGCACCYSLKLGVGGQLSRKGKDAGCVQMGTASNVGGAGWVGAQGQGTDGLDERRGLKEAPEQRGASVAKAVQLPAASQACPGCNHRAAERSVLLHDAVPGACRSEGCGRWVYRASWHQRWRVCRHAWQWRAQT